MQKQNNQRGNMDPVGANEIYHEYKNAVSYKNALGSRGLYQQSQLNRRYYVGDQWHGVNCGNQRPLVRHNIIKRIADYKLSVISSSPVSVTYSADGVPNTLDTKQQVSLTRQKLSRFSDTVNNNADIYLDYSTEIAVVMSALSDYFKVSAERVKLDDAKEMALKNAYITGTGLIYTYWDSDVSTGLYADSTRKSPIRGDINIEVLDVENVYFGNPSVDNIQAQPYIIIATSMQIEEIKQLALKHNMPKSHMQYIKPDDEYQNKDSVTLLTKLYKQFDENGNFKIMAVQTCKDAVIRQPWDLGISLYPIAKFNWEQEKDCIYGQSEITYLIPNQIAINRLITASVWAGMMSGMPIMLVNGDSVNSEISNQPGQIVKVYGQDNVSNSIKYLDPPEFASGFSKQVESLIDNTLKQAGATDAALGDLRPDNASAIIAVREAALMPLALLQNRYYSFCEDIARIWAQFWLNLYGKRKLKINDENGVWYFPFDCDRYKDLLISTRIDVGASSLWGQSQSVGVLEQLFANGIIDAVQYLEHMPSGTIPNVSGLIAGIKNKKQTKDFESSKQSKNSDYTDHINNNDFINSNGKGDVPNPVS